MKVRSFYLFSAMNIVRQQILNMPDWMSRINRKGFLEYMKKTLYEKSFVTGPGRDKERFDEILSKLEKVWNQYPDLRLGQLLVIVCGKSDLFMIEDEELLERLQYNQFPIE